MGEPNQSPEPEPQPQPQPQPDPLLNNFSTLNDVARDLTSLQDLAYKGSWKSILDKVSLARSLSLLSTPHDHLTYLAFNVLALSKLRRFKDALSELDSLDDFDSHHYRFETYPKIYPSRSGSMVPFLLRWLHALIPVHLGNRSDGLDRFYNLLFFVRERIRKREGGEGNGVCVRVWRRREVLVLNCLISLHCVGKEFGVCLDLVRDSVSRGYFDPVLVSKLGFLLMQVGDLDGAKASFNRVERLLSEKGDGWELSEVEFSNLVGRNRALVYLVGKDYVSAVREYEECIERDSMDVVAINNKALCLMYLRDLSDSIKVLENSLERVPTVALNETLVVNLCSMYELAYVNHSDIKRTLSNWIARVAPDDFDSFCTRS